MTGHLPVESPETHGFWQGCRRCELRYPVCEECGAWHWFPRLLCPHCLSERIGWVTAKGTASVLTFVVKERPTPGFPLAAPYVIALVELDEGPRLLTNVIGLDDRRPAVGMRVTVRWDEIGPGYVVPRFVPAPATDPA